MRTTAKQAGRPRRTGAWPGARPGFSLTELVVVLFMASALAYIAVPEIEIVRFKMDGAARGTMAALVSAQRLAVKRQHDVVVTFDEVNGRLMIHQDRDNDGSRDAGETIRVVPLEDGVMFGRGHAPALTSDPSPITFTEMQAGLPALRFIRNGSASEEGIFYLTSTRWERRPEFAKDTRAVRVERSTGRITWYAYRPPSWIENF